MLKDYTAVKSKNCSTEKFPNLELVLYNSQIAICLAVRIIRIMYAKNYADRFKQL